MRLFGLEVDGLDEFGCREFVYDLFFEKVVVGVDGGEFTEFALVAVPGTVDVLEEEEAVAVVGVVEGGTWNVDFVVECHGEVMFGFRWAKVWIFWD